MDLQIPWDDNEQFYKAWDEARTGYPWIDAIMTQLQREGWMHHLARHSVACFLTRGDLYVSWERGRDTFDRLLIDGDWRCAAVRQHLLFGHWACMQMPTDAISIVAQHKQWQLAVAVRLGFLQLILPRV